ALCNKLFRLELNDVLHFDHSTEELSNLLTPLPSSGKWYVRDVGQDPENIFGKYVQERGDIARINTLVCLLYQFGVRFFVQVFSFRHRRRFEEADCQLAAAYRAAPHGKGSQTFRGRDLEFKSSG